MKPIRLTTLGIIAAGTIIGVVGALAAAAPTRPMPEVTPCDPCLLLLLVVLLVQEVLKLLRCEQILRAELLPSRYRYTSAGSAARPTTCRFQSNAGPLARRLRLFVS
jgi:hypothetical protein